MKNTDTDNKTASARDPINLSTGRTVIHGRMNNGAQHASIEGSETGEMTESEWTEYCLFIKGRSVENYMLKKHTNVI